MAKKIRCKRVVIQIDRQGRPTQQFNKYKSAVKFQLMTSGQFYFRDVFQYTANFNRDIASIKIRYDRRRARKRKV